MLHIVENAQQANSLWRVDDAVLLLGCGVVAKPSVADNQRPSVSVQDAAGMADFDGR